MAQKRKPESPSDQLRRHLKSCGLTMAELARRSNVDPGQLSRFIRGERGLSLETLDQLSTVLQFELTMDGPAEPTPTKRKV